MSSSISATNKNEHLLVISVKEPIEGKVKPSMARDTSPHEAWHRYQAIVATLIRQLTGISNTDIEFTVKAPEALDSVKFWLLPQFDGNLSPLTSHSFRFTPNSPGAPYKISFTSTPSLNFPTKRSEGFTQDYQTVTIIGTNCPSCGSRWIKMAQLLATSKNKITIGTSPAPNSTPYLSTATPSATDTDESLLPPLPKIKTHQHWQQALTSPLGGKLRTAYKSITGQDPT